MERSKDERSVRKLGRSLDRLAGSLDRSGVLLVIASWQLSGGVAMPVYLARRMTNIRSLDEPLWVFLVGSTVLLLVGGVAFTRDAYRQYKRDYGVQVIEAGTVAMSSQRPATGHVALIRTETMLFALMFGGMYLGVGVQAGAEDLALVAGALSLVVMVVMTVAVHLIAVRVRRPQESRQP
jgi:uncharacterized membrane protein